MAQEILYNNFSLQFRRISDIFNVFKNEPKKKPLLSDERFIKGSQFLKSMNPQELETIMAQPYIINAPVPASEIIKNKDKYSGEIVIEDNGLYSLGDWLKTNPSLKDEVNLYSPLENLRYHFGDRFSLEDSYYGITKINNRLGLHARPSAGLVNLTNDYLDKDLVKEVTLLTEKMHGKANEIMSILMMCIKNGDFIGLKVTGGKDPRNSRDNLLDYINNFSDEPEQSDSEKASYYPSGMLLKYS